MSLSVCLHGHSTLCSPGVQEAEGESGSTGLREYSSHQGAHREVSVGHYQVDVEGQCVCVCVYREGITNAEMSAQVTALQDKVTRLKVAHYL